MPRQWRKSCRGCQAGSKAPLGLVVGLRAPHLHINEDIYKLMHLGPESQLCSCLSCFLFSWERGARMRLGISPGTGREQFPGEPQGAPGTPCACLQLVGRERVPASWGCRCASLQCHLGPCYCPSVCDGLGSWGRDWWAAEEFTPQTRVGGGLGREERTLQCRTRVLEY